MSERDEPLFVLRPQIGGRRGAGRYERVPRFRQFVLQRAGQRFGRVARLGVPSPKRHFGGAGAAADVPKPGPTARRCVVKAHVHQLRAGGLDAARKHLGYIERDGVEQDGSPGRLYSATSTDARDILSASLPGERHQFRFIISPEDAHRVDLTTFARELVAKVERDTGRRLIWGAVNHHDTDNPHVHLVVRGVDRDGKAVRIERDYISRGMRWQAQHLLTREIGLRTSRELARQLDREISQERFTTIDRRLAQLVTRDRTLDLRRLALTTDSESRARTIGRIVVLERLGLAARTGPRTWQLAENWDQALRALGERGDIIKRIHDALAGRGNPARYAVLHPSLGDKIIEGIVRRKGLDDELSGSQYAVIETVKGQAYYVPLDRETADSIREGSVVQVRAQRETWVKETDRVLERVAAAAGGVYDPVVHLASLESRPISIDGEPVRAQAVIHGNLRRLARLERYGLVTRRPDGAWTIPTGLVAALEQRQRAHPRIRARVEVLAQSPKQLVNLGGPTWLDRQQATDPTRAAYGFGAELSAMLRDRAGFLDRLGLTGTPREIRAALRRRERVALGSAAAAALGYTFVSDARPGFRGRLVLCKAASAGTRFVQVVDDTTRQVAVLPLTRGARAVEGQVVEVCPDHDGRLVVRLPSGLSRGGGG